MEMWGGNKLLNERWVGDNSGCLEGMRLYQERNRMYEEESPS